MVHDKIIKKIIIIIGPLINNNIEHFLFYFAGFLKKEAVTVVKPVVRNVEWVPVTLCLVGPNSNFFLI